MADRVNISSLCSENRAFAARLHRQGQREMNAAVVALIDNHRRLLDPTVATVLISAIGKLEIDPATGERASK